MLAAVVLATVIFFPAATQASDPPALRVITDPDPNFSGVWVDTENDELIVGDDNHHGVLVYSRTARGPALPLREIRGLSSLLDYPSQVVVDLTHQELWAVNNDTSDRAVVYARTDRGDVKPKRVIDFKLLGSDREKRTWGWAVDEVHGEVAGTFQRGAEGIAPGGSVIVFDRQTGDVQRMIKGPDAGLANPKGIFIDRQHDEILVVNEGHRPDVTLQETSPSITVYPRTAERNVQPIRTIQGPRTRLSSPKAIHLDPERDEIAITNGDNSIVVFRREDSGNVRPRRRLHGPRTGLSNPAGVFIDTVNKELVVGNWGNHTITVYRRTARGNTRPLRTINVAPGEVAVGFGNPGAMSLDPINDEFAVTNCVSHPRIAFFDRTAAGQVAPKRVIEGQDTGISRSLHGVFIDPVHDEVFVPSTLMNAILVFNRSDVGNVPPKRVIQGPNTGIKEPQGIHVDVGHDEIALVNEGAQSITIYPRDAEGDVAPLRRITSTGNALRRAVGVWVDVNHDEIVVATDDRVVVFPRLADGQTPPIRTIMGGNTMINNGRQVVVDTTNNEIIVATQGNRDLNPPVLGGLLVFRRLDNGNVAPKRFLRHVAVSNVKHPRSVWLWLDPNDNGSGEIGVGDSKENEVRVFDRAFE